MRFVRRCANCGEKLVWSDVAGHIGYVSCSLHPRGGFE